jgi:outer membrane scaffolding protein for murein synthesis (MipA/OmpV family)
MSLSIPRCALTAVTLAILSLAAHTESQAAEPTAVVGAGVAYVPEYSGAEKQRLRPALHAEYNWGNGFFASTSRGIGYGYDFDGVELSAALGHAGGRTDSDKNGVRSGSDALKGMGDIKTSVIANLGASTRLGELSVGINAQIALTNRDNGNTYSLHASHPLYKSAGDQVGLSMGAVYGDSKHAQTWYGVTPLQGAHSGFAAYKAGAGFEKVSLAGSWNHVIDKRWSVRTVGGVNMLVGDAADSPLTKKKTTPFVASTVNYTF